MNDELTQFLQSLPPPGSPMPPPNMPDLWGTYYSPTPSAPNMPGSGDISGGISGAPLNQFLKTPESSMPPPSMPSPYPEFQFLSPWTSAPNMPTYPPTTTAPSSADMDAALQKMTQQPAVAPNTDMNAFVQSLMRQLAPRMPGQQPAPTGTFPTFPSIAPNTMPPQIGGQPRNGGQMGGQQGGLNALLRRLSSRIRQGQGQGGNV